MNFLKKIYILLASILLILVILIGIHHYHLSDNIYYNCQYLGDNYNINVVYNLKSKYNIFTQTYSISGEISFENYPFVIDGDIYDKIELTIDKLKLSKNSNNHYAQQLLLYPNQLSGYHIQIEIPTKLVVSKNHHNKIYYYTSYNEDNSYIFISDYSQHYIETTVFYCNINP